MQREVGVYRQAHWDRPNPQYGHLNLNMTNNQFALLYDMYSRFQAAYYGKEAEPLLSQTEFVNHAPLVIIDCSKQNELLKTGPVDVRMEFESQENLLAETTANCLIMHDRVVDYSPLSGDVIKRPANYKNTSLTQDRISRIRTPADNCLHHVSDRRSPGLLQTQGAIRAQGSSHLDPWYDSTRRLPVYTTLPMERPVT